MFRYSALRTVHNIASFTSRSSKHHHHHPNVYIHRHYSSSSPVLLKTKTTTTNKSSMMQLIKKLRNTTGAPMVECKKAISAEGVDGDYDKATEWLRKNGSAKAASKLAGRDASEGLVGIAINDEDPTNVFGAIVRVASETDFASRSPAFSSLVNTVAESAITLSRRHRSSSGTMDNTTSLSDVAVMDVKDILATSVGVEDTRSVKDALDEAVLAIRENLQIASATAIVPGRSDAVLAGYVHGKVDGKTLAGTAAAIVELIPTASASSSVEEIREIGKRLAMHIVAAKPTYLSPDQIPDSVLEKEREILLEQMKETGKSADIMEKIVSGRLRKFYEQVCLMEQAHMVEEGNPKINKLMKKLGLKVVQFESDSI